MTWQRKLLSTQMRRQESLVKRGLGKGLGALISSENEFENGIQDIKLNNIEPDRKQPRKSFDDEKMKELSESIRQHGVVQPIIVKRDENDSGIFRIVAGERRWRAARQAGLATIPAIVRELSGRQAMEIALIENLQREDLNPIEEAEAFERLIRDFNLTQEEISDVVGKSRPAVANSLRLLNLGEIVRQAVIDDEITSGHARAMVAIENKDAQKKILEEIIKRGLNVRETEKAVKKLLKTKAVKGTTVLFENKGEIEEVLMKYFSTKVKIQSLKKGGKIIIDYYSKDELDRILEMMKIQENSLRS